MRRWAALGWGALACLGQGKSFVANPILGSPGANRLGLHAGRVVLADLATRWRWMLLGHLMPAELRDRFHRDGFVVVESFLSRPECSAIHAELGALGGDAREMIQGDTRTQRILLDRAAVRATPTLARLASDPRLLGWLGYGAARWHRPRLYLQRVRRGAARRDPQTRLHSDTFHPTMKAWLFLDDVSASDGPLEYVPGSHRLSGARLAWEKAASTSYAARDVYSQRGSLRVEESELAGLGLGRPVQVLAEAGTLVIANTHGFHRRGASAPHASRLELWAYSRSNPFSPLPGFGLMSLGAVEDALVKLYLEHRDRRAARRGAQPTWRLIDRDAMLGDLTSDR